jgi:outer membrane protein insertion porin family
MKHSPLTYLASLFVGLLIMGTIPSIGIAKDDRILVTKVTFIGNESVSKEDLLPVMIMRPTGIFGFFDDVEYDKDILEEDVQFIELYYKQHGWLDVQIVHYVGRVDSLNKLAKIRITIDEGPRTHVVDVLPLGNKAFTDEEILEAFDIESGDPLDRIKNRAGSERVARLYAEHGYLEASVNPSVMVDRENLEAFIDISVTEGEQFKVGQIIMSGFKHSKSMLVKRELEFKTGNILSYSSLALSQRNMYETGLFRSVFIRQEPSLYGDSTSKDILIEMVEKPPILFTSSVGYATLEKLRGRVGVRNENIMGTGRGAGVETWLSYIDRGVELSYLEPWTFGYHWNTDVTVTGEFRDEPSFDYTSYSAVVTESRRIFGRGFFSLSYRHENAEYTNIDVFEFDEETSPRIRSLNQSFSYDTRNDPFSPSRGWVASLTNEYALQFLSSSNEFFKTRANFRYFYSLRRSTVLATNIEVGWVDAGGGLGDIPLGERLYAGGPNVLRGFPYRSVGPVDEDDGTPLGGRAKLAWNVLEVRQHLWRWVSMVGFYDVGNIFEQADDWDFSNLRSTPGLGVRVSSPIGLFRVDYGFNINPKPGEDPGAFHISIGHAF